MKCPLSRWACLTEGRRHQGGGSKDPARLKKVASRCSHDGMLMVFVGVGHQFGVCPITRATGSWAAACEWFSQATLVALAVAEALAR